MFERVVNANKPPTHTTQYFEMIGVNAIYHDGSVAATTPVRPPWELGGAARKDPATGGKAWSVLLRFYAPLEFWFERLGNRAIQGHGITTAETVGRLIGPIVATDYSIPCSAAIS